MSLRVNILQLKTRRWDMDVCIIISESCYNIKYSKKWVSFVPTLCAYMHIICKSVTRDFCNNIHHSSNGLRRRFQQEPWVLFDTRTQKYFVGSWLIFNSYFQIKHECYSTLWEKRNASLSCELSIKSYSDKSCYSTLRLSKVKSTKVCNWQIIIIFQLMSSVTNKMLSTTLHPHMNGAIPHQLPTKSCVLLCTVHWYVVLSYTK